MNAGNGKGFFDIKRIIANKKLENVKNMPSLASLEIARQESSNIFNAPNIEHPVYNEKFKEIDELDYQKLLEDKLLSTQSRYLRRKLIPFARSGKRRPETSSHLEGASSSNNTTDDFNFYDRLFNASHSSIAPVFKKSQF